MSKSTSKKRLDILLHERGLVDSREKAKAIIMAGDVLVHGKPAQKAGKEYPLNSEITIKGTLKYVSRGGLKLEAALDHFNIDPQGSTILDAGASTGGFTDCLLQRGARLVIAVDVGYGQFHWKLRNNEKVILLERTNIRNLDPGEMGRKVQGVVADLSFISLKLVLNNFYEILEDNGWALPMVKPQFEVGKDHTPKGGVVKDKALISQTVDSVERFAEEIGFICRGSFESPVKGPKGNQEVFLCLEKQRERM